MNKLISIVNILVLLVSCSNKKTETSKNETHQEEVLSNFVSLVDLQIKSAGIELGTIELKNLKTSIKANGMLTVPNQNKALVTSVNSGVIRTLSIQPGNFVEKG